MTEAMLTTRTDRFVYLSNQNLLHISFIIHSSVQIDFLCFFLMQQGPKWCEEAVEDLCTEKIYVDHLST